MRFFSQRHWQCCPEPWVPSLEVLQAIEGPWAARSGGQPGHGRGFKPDDLHVTFQSKPFFGSLTKQWYGLTYPALP